MNAKIEERDTNAAIAVADAAETRFGPDAFEGLAQAIADAREEGRRERNAEVKRLAEAVSTMGDLLQAGASDSMHVAKAAMVERGEASVYVTAGQFSGLPPRPGTYRLVVVASDRSCARFRTNSALALHQTHVLESKYPCQTD